MNGPIVWYPGHMAKARRQLQASLSEVDAVIEILDARLPLSSRNPDFASLFGAKPCLTLLNKSALADEKREQSFIHKLEREGRRVLAVDCKAYRNIARVTPALRELAESIGRYGILQPLTVRRGEDGYELIAGERRLRAAKLAGLREVPCLAVRSDEEESALLSLIENLQRQDLHYMEEAAAIAKLIAVYDLSQEQAAERLGKSQSAVANKLRLLRLSPACVALLREGGLSERHARALLRLSDENERLAALRVIVERGCNVAQAEAYIESVLQRAAVTPPRRRPTFIVKDVRLFLNTIRRSMGIMQRAGVDAACEREDTDEEIRLTIRIPRTGAAKTA